MASPSGTWRASLEAAGRVAFLLADGKRASPAVVQLAARGGPALIGVAVKLSLAAALIAAAAAGIVAAHNDAEPQSLPSSQNAPVLKSATVPDPDDPKQAGHFVGQVTGPDGQPFTGAQIFIAPRDPRFPAQDAGLAQPLAIRATSGAGGRFEFDARDMTYTEIDGLPARRKGLLFAKAEGYAPDWIFTWGRNGAYALPGDPIKGADLTLRLVRDDASIHGRFLDHEERPVAGARVRLVELTVLWNHDLDAHLEKSRRSKHGWPSFGDLQSLRPPYVLPGISGETLTDEDGRFRMAGLGRDRLAVLEVKAPRVVTTSLTVMTRDAPDVVIDGDPAGKRTMTILGAGFTLQLRPGRTVRSIVRDRDTHEPISGMWVGPDAQRMKYEKGGYPTVSDANGRFTIYGIDPEVKRPEIFAVSQPGQPYMTATSTVDGPPLIDCTRGIPYQLRTKILVNVIGK